jgi:hypothetical protein
MKCLWRRSRKFEQSMPGHVLHDGGLFLKMSCLGGNFPFVFTAAVPIPQVVVST